MGFAREALMKSARAGSERFFSRATPHNLTKSWLSLFVKLCGVALMMSDLPGSLLFIPWMSPGQMASLKAATTKQRF